VYAYSVTTRPLRPSDIPILTALAGPYPYPDVNSPLIELITVVADGSDTPIACFIAERLVQSYLIVAPMHPAARLAAIRLLHEAVPPLLKAKGYNSIEAFIPPQLAGTFGRRLERTWGWVRNWQSWCKRF